MQPVTTPSGRVPARRAADPSSCPVKKTDADARAATVNPANEHVGEGKIKCLCRRRCKEEVKQTFNTAVCVMNEHEMGTEQEVIKSNLAYQPVSTGQHWLKVKLSPSLGDRRPVQSAPFQFSWQSNAAVNVQTQSRHFVST